MDQAGCGASAIDEGIFDLAVTCYTEAIAENPVGWIDLVCIV